MTTEEALHIIKQACASISATLATHERIQTAILIIEAKVTKPAAKSKGTGKDEV